MRTIIALTLAIFLTGCDRGPFLKVRLENLDGSPISGSGTSLSKTFAWDGDGDVPGGGVLHHHMRVVDITSMGVLVDLAADYSPAAPLGLGSQSFHKQFILSKSGTTIVTLFDKVRFCAEVAANSSDCVDHRSHPNASPVTFVP